MTEVQIFDHEDFGNVRSILMDGEAWFLLTDLAKVLGYRDAANAKRVLRDSQYSTPNMSTRADLGVSRGSTPTVINESGLYRLMMRSTQPNAEQFQVWIEDEVLPSIRKTGGYGVVPGSFADALELAAKNQRELENAQKELEAAQPKLETYDAWLDTSEAIEMTDFAKRIGFTPAGRFTAALRDTGVLRKDKRSDNSFRNLPTAEWEDSFIVRSHQLPNGRWIDLALINSGGQLEVLEHLRDRGYEV